MMRILHTEASNGWGGQEIRILREAIGMRNRGHEVFFAVVTGGKLAQRARELGFVVEEFPMERSHAFRALYRFMKMIRKYRITVVNTHSSFDAWWGGLAGRLTGCKVMRTRHISTHIRPGINAYLLYRLLADQVVTTCISTAESIRRLAKLSEERCVSIPTGIEVTSLKYDPVNFRKRYGIEKDECVVGTACVLRSWKGLEDLIQAAKILENVPKLKWLIVGSGSMEAICKEQCKKLGLENKVIFTGFLDDPFPAMSAMDIFALLSTANEGVSQASLQAGYFGKPLITTKTGGLPEVCLDGKTGFLVEVRSPQEVAEKVRMLVKDPLLRTSMGMQGKELVLEKFTMERTLDAMEALMTQNS